MLQVPTSLAGLLSLLAPCFTQPTFQTFSMLLVGFVGRVRDCTVTGMLQACWVGGGVASQPRARLLRPPALGSRRAGAGAAGLPGHACSSRRARRSVSPLTTPCSGALDARCLGAHYLHDGAQPEGSGRRTRWGNCWVVVVLVVELPCLGGRQVALPVLFRLFRPKDDDHPDRPSQPELATDADRHGDRALPGPTAIFQQVTITGPDGRSRSAIVSDAADLAPVERAMMGALLVGLGGGLDTVG